MDDHSLEIISAILAKRLPGMFITKIHQMTPCHLLLRLRKRGQSGEQRLLISAASIDPGLHLTSRRYLNPPRPLRFCAYLRHHLQGAIIATLEKIEDDRLVIIKTLRKDGAKQLIIELTGKRSNVILCRGEKMQIGARMFESATDQRLRPGATYCLPETPVRGNKSETPFLLDRIVNQKQAANLLSEELQQEELIQNYDDWFFPRYQKHYGNREILRLEKALRRHGKRLQKRKKRLAEERRDKESHLNDSHLGDLLKGQLQQLERGAQSVKLTNYWSPALEEVEVTLNPALTPLANLEKLYKNSKKAKRGLNFIEKRQLETQREVEYCEELLFQFEGLKSNPNISDEEQKILELASDLAEKRRGQATSKKCKKPKKPAPEIDRQSHQGVERITGVNGGTIYIGRNVLGNENIYRHLSAPDDLWFHTRNRPGAHILLKRAPGTENCATEELQAATLAAINSRGKDENLVEVTMTQVKHLRKPKGGRPGQVLLTGPQKTLTVKPQLPKDEDHE